MDLSALAEHKFGRAVSGLTRTNVALIRSGLWCPSDYFADRSSLRSLAGHRPRISFDASPLANRFYGTSRLIQNAIAQHGMHDDLAFCEEQPPKRQRWPPITLSDPKMEERTQFRELTFWEQAELGNL